MGREAARVKRDPSRGCVFTTMIGGYETLNEQPTAADSVIPHICLTDDPSLRSESWQVRLVKPAFEMDPIRSQRKLKIRPEEHLDDIDWSIYIDNTVRLTASAREVLRLVPAGVPVGLVRHSFRDSVLDEFHEVATLGLDDPSRIFEQLNHYQLVAPEVLDEPPFWTGLIFRDHTDAAVMRMEDMWLEQVLRYSRRDQLSVNLVIKKSEIQIKTLSLDNHLSEYHRWPNSSVRRLANRRPSVSMVPASARLHFAERALDDQISQASARERAFSSQVIRADALEQALTAHKTRSAALKAARDGMLRSKSWRLMAPARRVGDAARRIRDRWRHGLGRLRPDFGDEGIAREVWYGYFGLMYRVRQRTRGRRWLVVGPDEVTQPFLLWKVVHLLGIRIVRSTDRGAPAAYRHDGDTEPTSAPPEADVVVNGGCTDVSKRRVERAMVSTFGYGLAVDPLQHVGQMVVKSDANATHDGEVIQGPILAPDPTKVYQRLIDNEYSPGQVEEFRATVVAGKVVVVFRKRRELHERFANAIGTAKLLVPLDAFSAEECSRIGDLATDMGLDVCELDVLRDRGDGRVYVVDANNTPFSPPRAAYDLSGIVAMHRIAGAFERAWGSSLGR